MQRQRASITTHLDSFVMLVDISSIVRELDRVMRSKRIDINTRSRGSSRG